MSILNALPGANLFGGGDGGQQPSGVPGYATKQDLYSAFQSSDPQVRGAALDAIVQANGGPNDPRNIRFTRSPDYLAYQSAKNGTAASASNLTNTVTSLIDQQRTQAGLPAIDWSKQDLNNYLASPPSTSTTPAPAPSTPLPVPKQTTDIGGNPLSTSAILPGVIPAINPSFQQAFSQFLQSQVGKGMNPYPGPTSPNVNNTILPQVASAWSPTGGAGQDFLKNNLTNGTYTTPSPILQGMMMNGGTGGPGNLAMKNIMQTGGSNPQLVAMLQAIAQGNTSSGPGASLAPFVTGGPGNSITPPATNLANSNALAAMLAQFKPNPTPITVPQLTLGAH